MDDLNSLHDALKAAEGCYKGTFATVKTCYDGAQGMALLVNASAIWNKAFPAKATVPHIFVNDKDTAASYAAIKSALCAAGSPSAACKK
jgi:hypothetical protein